VAGAGRQAEVGTGGVRLGGWVEGVGVGWEKRREREEAAVEVAMVR